MGDAITVGKDLITLLRDGALLLAFALLFFFPIQFNTILTDAGFEEGSFAGLKWRRDLKTTTDQLAEANARIDALQAENTALAESLRNAQPQVRDSAWRARSQQLLEQQRETLQATEQTKAELAKTIDANTLKLQPYVIRQRVQSSP
ncbi:MAG: hypothetical protein AAF499_11710 [Pseudomonadota bacterium]